VSYAQTDRCWACGGDGGSRPPAFAAPRCLLAGLHKLAVEAAKRVVRIEAAESRASVSPPRRAERRQLVERLRALRAEARDCPDDATKAAMAQAREALRLFDSGG